VDQIYELSRKRHVERMAEIRNAYKNLLGKAEGKKTHALGVNRRKI
jgi:hypothetical protein